ncbi:Variant-specific surface protein [Giardia duodenalis assemblage B]|uniref:Variant-specific surface protein n=1 Tax=Giardia duodenalis assemblage B TaxID=1394984 RepID=A0A132NXJ7_GIAIN|nr:Variant-specific surface protein [Giardia intestinalis assemblage B]
MVPHCHFHTVWCCSCDLSACFFAVPLVTRCHDSVLRASGYYKVDSATGPCTSCESNSGSVTGVKGCASCAAPTGSTGPVLCYLVGAAPLTPSPHVLVGMSALLLVSHVSPTPCWVRRMVAECPRGSE